MTVETLVTRIEEVLNHPMPDAHKLPRLAAIVATYRKQSAKKPPETTTEENTTDE